MEKGENLHRIPPLGNTEPISATPRITANSNIMQHARVSVKRRVDESNRALASRQPLLIDARQDRAPDGRGSRRASDESRRSSIEDKHVVPDGADVRISASVAVVDAPARAETVVVGAGVRRVRRVRGGEVGRDGRGLVGWDGVDVREAAAAGEAGYGCFLVLEDVSACRQEGRAYG